MTLIWTRGGQTHLVEETHEAVFEQVRKIASTEKGKWITFQKYGGGTLYLRRSDITSFEPSISEADLEDPD